jgi:hypothetical protein
VGKQFESFLPLVMTPLLEGAAQDTQFSMEDADESEEVGEVQLDIHIVARYEWVSLLDSNCFVLSGCSRRLLSMRKKVRKAPSLPWDRAPRSESR